MIDEGERDDIDGAVVSECDLPEPPDKVWRALTRPEIVAEWLMPNDVSEKVGARFTLKPAETGAGLITCQVLTAEPPRLLRYSWSEPDPSFESRELRSVVTFVLSETEDGGTHLRIVHELVLAAQAVPSRLLAMRKGLPPLRREPWRRAFRSDRTARSRSAPLVRLRRAA